MSLNQRLIAGLFLLVALVTTVALLAARALQAAAGMTPGAYGHARRVDRNPFRHLRRGRICVAVLRPLRHAAEQIRAIGQGNLEQRLEWSADDSLGQIANDVNRMAVHVRDLRETEFGRKQMEHQLSDAVVQSIFEPVIVTDARGRC